MKAQHLLLRIARLIFRRATKTSSNEDEVARYNAYIAERRALVDAGFQQSLSYDTTAITLAGGALGLSLTFIKDIVGAHHPKLPLLLFLGWGILVIAILATLASFQLSVHAYNRQREIADFEYQYPLESSDRRNVWAGAVGIANWLSLLSIVIGVGLLTTFVANNTWSN